MCDRRFFCAGKLKMFRRPLKLFNFKNISIFMLIFAICSPWGGFVMPSG